MRSADPVFGSQGPGIFRHDQKLTGFQIRACWERIIADTSKTPFGQIDSQRARVEQLDKFAARCLGDIIIVQLIDHDRR
jgi:hypothetical protein